MCILLCSFFSFSPTPQGVLTQNMKEYSSMILESLLVDLTTHYTNGLLDFDFEPVILHLLSQGHQMVNFYCLCIISHLLSPQ